jgi:argininosuccinate lyase
MATVLVNIRLREERAREASARGYMNATELADYLARRGMPFREAHETVGRIVLAAIGRGLELHELSLEELRALSPLIEADVYDALSLEQTLATKSQAGGTSPARVAEAIAAARASLVES